MPKDNKAASLDAALEALMRTLHSPKGHGSKDEIDEHIEDALEAIFGKGNVKSLGDTQEGFAEFLSKLSGDANKTENTDPVSDDIKTEVISIVSMCLDSNYGIDSVATAFVAACATHAELHESEVFYVKTHEFVVEAAHAIRSIGCMRFGTAKFKKAVTAQLQSHSDATMADATSRMTGGSVFDKLRPRSKAN